MVLALQPVLCLLPSPLRLFRHIILAPPHLPRMVLLYSHLSLLPLVMMFSGPPRILASSILLLQLLTPLLPQLLTALLLQVFTALKFSHPTPVHSTTFSSQPLTTVYHGFPVHSTTSRSQPLTTVYHRSLRKILNQDQHITTSSRKLRSRYKPFLSGQ